MLNSQQVNQWVEKVMNALPPGVKQISHDMQKNLHAAMMSAFEHLDLVTREEFDAQAKVLHKTRVKLEELEKKLYAWEEEHTVKTAVTATKTKGKAKPHDEL